MTKAQSLTADWTRTLAHLEQALNQAVAQIQQREQALAAPPASAPLQLCFARFEEKAAVLTASPRGVAARLDELDAALREGEDAFRQWLSRAEAARGQLAREVGRAD